MGLRRDEPGGCVATTALPGRHSAGAAEAGDTRAATTEVMACAKR